jgi:hypothetical protein
MKDLITAAIVIVMNVTCAKGGENAFGKFVKGSVYFRDEFDATSRYPHILRVYLRLDNIGDSSLPWVSNNLEGIKAELLDAAGNPVEMPPSASSISFGTQLFLLPYGSRLDWLISHGGVSMAGDAKDKYAVMVGGHGWLIPIATAASYKLRISWYGLPRVGAGNRTADKIARGMDHPKFVSLLSLPPTRINVTTDVEPACAGKAFP